MPRHLVMICPTLVDQGGHEHDYTQEVAQAALNAGAGASIFVPPTAKDLALPGKILCLCPPDPLPHPIFGKITALFNKLVFYIRTFHQTGAAETLFFIHTISQKQLAIVALAWIIAMPKNKSLTLFLRHPIGHSISDRLFTGLVGFSSHCGVSFVSDSDLLAENLAPRLGCKVDIVPIPVTQPPARFQRKNPQPLCSYFGARRKTKGFQFLPALLDGAAQAYPGVQFIIQAYAHRDDKTEASVSDALAAIEKRADTKIINRLLSSAEFTELVFKSDLSLIPYDPAVYRLGTSGNFVMSIVARSVTIVSEGSWMAHQVRKQKMTRAVLLPAPASPAQIAAVMQQAIDILNRPDIPSPEEQIWCQQQSGKGVWDVLQHRRSRS